MAEFDRAQLRQWAVRGAEQRLQEIATEAAAIHRAFPELRGRGVRGAVAATVVTAVKGRRRGRANMSAAQRKAVSERMRKYWQADQRRTKKALGRATPRQRLSTCGRLSHHGQPPCIPASPRFSSAPVAAALPQSCHKISRMPVEVL